MDVIDRVPSLQTRAVTARQYFADQRTRHRAYVTKYGEDMPEVREWRWTS
jgi:xylulose-5-phosphate/fructose-6-phosphate phosphoketolase